MDSCRNQKSDKQIYFIFFKVVFGSENGNILIHVTEGERVMFNVYIMSGYVIVSHQGSSEEKRQSGTSHHDSREWGRSEHFGAEVRSDEVRKNQYH